MKLRIEGAASVARMARMATATINSSKVTPGEGAARAGPLRWQVVHRYGIE
jgi:hypothetical protein